MISPEFHRSKYLLLFAAVVSFCLLNGCSQPRTQPRTEAEQWRAKILEAHGGSEALARVATLVYNGNISTKSDRGSVALVLSRPQKLRTTMKYSNRSEDRILLGGRGWRDFGTGFEEAAGPSLDAMLFQYNHLSLPMGFLDNDYKITYIKRNIGDQTFPALELTGGNGPSMTVTIDPDTELIRMVEARLSAGPRVVLMGVGYDDYRGVAGVMLPHRLINFVNDQGIAESRFYSVTVNAVDQNSFAVEPQAAGK